MTLDVVCIYGLYNCTDSFLVYGYILLFIMWAMTTKSKGAKKSYINHNNVAAYFITHDYRILLTHHHRSEQNQ